jgi:hypothetical protein
MKKIFKILILVAITTSSLLLAINSNSSPDSKCNFEWNKGFGTQETILEGEADHKHSNTTYAQDNEDATEVLVPGAASYAIFH